MRKERSILQKGAFPRLEKFFEEKVLGSVRQIYAL
jgi:hypothetical protein